MRRLYAAFFLLLLASLPAHAENYTDWWWNPDQSGQGINVGQEGGLIFVSWFTYDETGAGMWLVMGGPLTGNSLTSPLYRTTGPKLGTPFDPTQVVETQVGEGTLTFADNFDATFNWTVDSKSGSLALVRESFGAPPLAGRFLSDSVATATSQCTNTGDGIFAWSDGFTITDSTLVDNQLNENDFVTAYSGSLEHAGRWLRSQGTFAGGQNPVFSAGSYAMDILPIDTAIFLDNAITSASVAGCQGTTTAVGLQ